MRKRKPIQLMALLLAVAMLMSSLSIPLLSLADSAAADTVGEQIEGEYTEGVSEQVEEPTEPDKIQPEDDLPVDETCTGEEQTTEPEVTIEPPPDPLPEETLPMLPPATEEPEAPAENPVETPEETTEPVADEEAPEETTEETAEEPAVTEPFSLQDAIEARGYAYVMLEYSVQAFDMPDLQHLSCEIAPDSILLVAALSDTNGVSVAELHFMTAEGEHMTVYADASCLPECSLNEEELDNAMAGNSYSHIDIGNRMVAIFVANVEQHQPVGQPSQGYEEPAATVASVETEMPEKSTDTEMAVPEDQLTDEENAATDAELIPEEELTEDAALTTAPLLMMAPRAYTFNLRPASGAIGYFTVGQTNVHGSSGDDSYPQIAVSPSHGTIYATPHYLNGVVVYCLEHRLNGPGEMLSGNERELTGPYTIADLNSYKTTSGFSGTVFSDRTMHALGWVLRHTYPFMVLDNYDPENENWTRAAGQFAIREVIKQLEGAHFVRDYWEMDEFFLRADSAPGEYLTYARWLAENAIEYSRRTGTITASNKSVTMENGKLVGTVKLTTDADHMRIPRSAGTLTGNTRGSDSSYYYLNSGDTITVTASGNTLSFIVESMASEDDEACFLIGVAQVAIQNVLIPQTGYPYPLKKLKVSFELPYGSVNVTKKDASTGALLKGAVFELISSNTVVQTATTGANGVASFKDVPPGSYTVREKTPPQGYQLSVNSTQNVMVTNGQTSSATFSNDLIIAKIRIRKTDQLTGEPLMGVVFTITRLSAPASAGGAGVGDTFTITTDASGVAETGWLDWGKYQVEETSVPDGYVNNHFSTTIEAYANGQTYVIDVENEPEKGWIQLTKKNSLDGHPIAGVEFQIYYNDEYGTGLAGTMTTNEQGIAKSPALRKGSYLVKEAGEPTGYVYDLVEMNATVVSEQTTKLHATNQPIQGKIQIIKKDQLTGELLAGAEFTITRLSGLPSHNGEADGEIVAVITTDANGVAVSPLLTYGTYKVEETLVPEHFVDNQFSTEVAITADNLQTYEIAVENEPTKGWIQITKTDRVNGNPIKGVVFEVYYNDEYGSGLATTMTTDENGVAVSEPLRKGKYLIKEKGATAGYVFEEIQLDATVRSDETTELAITNQPVLVRLKLYKRDADEYSGDLASAPTVRGDGILTGAEFQVLAAANICDRQGNVIHEKGDVVIASLVTAGDDASVTTGDLWPGKYKIVELTPPVGYRPSTASVIVDARSAAEQSEEAVITYEGVVENEILYGARAIVKILGGQTDESDPTKAEIPEQGAEFQVYLKKAGSYENTRPFERDILKTDKHGYAKTKSLPYGIYVLEQTKGMEGYEIKGPITFEIDGTESLVNPPPLTLNDRPILYRLRLIKTDAETGNIVQVSNTSFKLKDADGQYVTQKVYYPKEMEIDTFTTDETGTVTLPETVTWGYYTIEEIKAPEGYLIRTEELPVFVGSSGDQPGQTYELDIEIPNDPVKGQLVLEKKGLQLTGFRLEKDAYGNEVHTPVYEERYLEGAVFEICAAQQIIGRDGTLWYEAGQVVDTITTTADGMDTSKVLPLGVYEVEEVSAPSGYFFDSSPVTVELEYADDQTPMVQFHLPLSNAYMPAEITLVKEKEVIQTTENGELLTPSITRVPGEGFVFGLYTNMDIAYPGGTLMADTLVATATTDANGVLTITGHFPHGEYYLRELSAPAGWQMSSDKIFITLSPDLQAESAPTLRYSHDAPVLNKLIYGTITLTKTDITGEETLPGAVIEISEERGTVIYRERTDENGQIADIPATPGEYTFREVYAPEGYALNEAVMSFTVDENGNVTGDTVIRDDYSRFTIRKQDENQNPLMGVEFSLLCEDGSILMTAQTNQQGIATFEKVPFGSYRIVETRPLAGYYATDAAVEVTIDGTFINSDEPLATITNIPNEVVILKVDQAGNPLAGAEFALVDAFGETFATAVSDDEGKVCFTKIPYGSYTIVETKAPEGYLLSKEEIPVKINASYTGGDEPVATMVNRLKQIKYIKVDTSGNFLPGAEFSLINSATNEAVEVVTSNEQGEFIFTKFDYGGWIIRETEAPEGYNRMEDIYLQVDENWTEPEPITLVNIPSTYMFFKSDNRKNPLAGVTFAVEDELGNKVQEVISGEDGVVYVYGLTPGRYTIRELEPLEGYSRTDDTLEVVIDENYTVPEKLKRLVNYPTIATGVEISPNVLTWIGVGLLVTGVVIFLLANRKYRKKK